MRLMPLTGIYVKLRSAATCGGQFCGAALARRGHANVSGRR